MCHERHCSHTCLCTLRVPEGSKSVSAREPNHQVNRHRKIFPENFPTLYNVNKDGDAGGGDYDVDTDHRRSVDKLRVSL